MTFELRLRQQQKTYIEISKIKEEIKRIIKKKQEAHAIVKSCSQKIPKLYKKMFEMMDLYDKTW